MKKKTRFEEADFVARWIAGELSPSESADFEAWMAANPRQQVVFDEMRELWRSSGSIILKQGLSAEARWQRIQQATGASDSEEPTTVSRGPRWISWLHPVYSRFLRLF